MASQVKLENERLLLFQAAGSAYGIVVRTADLNRDLQLFYQAYRMDKAMLPPLEFRKSPWKPTEEIWLVRVDRVGEAEPPAPQGEAPPPAIDPLDLDSLSLEDLGL